MRKRIILVAVAALAAGCAQDMRGHHHENEEKDEVKMNINDVPAPVRDALMRESKGATIATVDQEQKHGKTVYEADAMIDGKNWEIKVDSTGQLLSKKLDDEEHEKHDKD